jgi:hypothetical protein
MAILSSLFGTTGQQQPAVGAQALTTAEIPKQLQPYYSDILSKAQALYDKRTEEGFKPYEGPTIAQFTPEQQATFAGIAGLQGQVAPKFAEAEQLTKDAAAGITGAEIQEAMSPYQQAVTDIEKRESQKAFEQNVLPKIRAAQVAQGSFGGTRGTLLEAQSLADQQRMLADIQAKGSAAAFADARKALEAERTRMGQGATQLANIAPTALKTGLAELGAQQTVGELKQRQAQTALDEAYRQFLEEKQEPYEAMQKYQAVVTGAPITTTQYAPPPTPGPSLGQTLIGGLGTAAGLYGAFTGKNPLAAVGLTKSQTGGGIADLMPVINKQQGGDFNYFRDAPFGRILKGTGKGLKDTANTIRFLPYRIAGEATAGLERFALRPLSRFFVGKDPGPIYESHLLKMFPGSTAFRSDEAIQDRVKVGDSDIYLDDTVASQVKPDVIPPGGEFGGSPIGELVIPGTDGKTIKLEGAYPDKKTIEDSLASQKKSDIKKEKKDIKKEGLASVVKEDKVKKDDTPSKFDLREQAIREKEEGLRSLYGQYAEKGERDMEAAKDARFREQSANIAKTFAQFAQRGGGENMLQKAIATTGDNIDQFVATDKDYRKDVKDIENKIQKGELEEAKLDYDIVRDRADRELTEEQRELEELRYTDEQAYKKKVFELEKKKQEQDLKYKYDALEAEKEAAIAEGKIKSADITALNNEIEKRTGMTYSEGPGGVMMLQGTAFDGETQAKINDIAAIGQRLLAKVGPAIYYETGLHQQYVIDPLNELIKKDSQTSEGDNSNQTAQSILDMKK